MLLNTEKNYLGGRSNFGNNLLDMAANEIVQMKEYGINGDYQYGLYPYPSPNVYLNRQMSNFGKKPRRRSSNKKRIGWCMKKKRVVGVYEFKDKKGKRFSNGNKLVKGKKIFKQKSMALKACR
jgi:hypothetical protein